MRVLVLPRYAPLGASSRLRMYQYLPALYAAGVEADMIPLFGDDYVANLYAGRVSKAQVAKAYLRRLHCALLSRRYAAIWLEKELWPWLPAWLERLMLPVRPALVVDYDDAVFHRYDQHPWLLVRGLLGRKIDAVMRRADLVTAGNGYLAARASAAGCSWVERMPTVVDLDRYAQFPRHAPGDGGLVVGWIGSPATAGYLRPLAPVLEPLVRERGIRALAIGARPDQVEGTPFASVPWAEDTESEQVASFDIGIMPLPDELWERGKCGYKLIQYMACGLPVVASPVGINKEIVKHGYNGLLAADPREWRQALQQLIDDGQQRIAMGTAGRMRVEQGYSLQAQAPRLVDLLQDAARRRRGS